MIERDQLAALQGENARLIALLEDRGIEWSLPSEPPPTESSPPILEPEPSRLSTAEKVALFRRLLRGRTDVYPIRWESKTIGKSGYAPACGNDKFARNANLHGEAARRARAMDGSSEKAQLPQPLANRLIRLAAFQNPEFYKKQPMRFSVWDEPRVIGCAENYPNHIALPRGCLDAALELLRDNAIDCELVDERYAGSPLDVAFAGTLRMDQEFAVVAMLDHDAGVLCAPTAFGKTVTAAAMIARRGREHPDLVFPRGGPRAAHQLFLRRFRRTDQLLNDRWGQQGQPHQAAHLCHVDFLSLRDLGHRPHVLLFQPLPTRLLHEFLRRIQRRDDLLPQAPFDQRPGHKSLQAQASGKKLNATTNACDGSDSSCYIRSRFPQHRCIMTLRDFVRPCIFTPQRTLHENTQLLLAIFSL
jgi:hypothetical protein